MGQAKRVRRQEQAKPIAERFFAWIDRQFETQGFLPSSPLLAALSYIRERRTGPHAFVSASANDSAAQPRADGADLIAILGSIDFVMADVDR